LGELLSPLSWSKEGVYQHRLVRHRSALAMDAT
jgi:hypothetical protein